MFVQELKTGKMNGWVFNAAENKPWVFKGVTIAPEKFDPEVAPDLSVAIDNKQWSCSKKRVIFDDVSCSRSVSSVPEFAPGAEVRFWGYRSDGRTHTWEASASKSVLEGPKDESPT